MGFTTNKKNLVLGVANKKDLYLGTEGVENINNNLWPSAGAGGPPIPSSLP